MPLSASTPSTAKARVIGAMTIRLASVQPLIVIGVNSGETSVTAVTMRSDGRDRGCRRADRTGQPQRRRGQQEGMAPDLFEMARQIAQPPQLAQMNPELEQAALVQRQQAIGAGLQVVSEAFDRL